MKKIIAIFNQAGGCGKTTLTMNLGYHLNRRGYRVLLVDLDPQASLTNFMGMNPAQISKHLFHALVELESLPIYIQNGISIAPSNIKLAEAEPMLLLDGMRDIRLQTALSEIELDYDYILIDCLPSLGILATIALTASTDILIPMQPEPKCLWGTGGLFRTISQVKQRQNQALKIMGVAPTLYDKRNAQHAACLETIHSEIGEYNAVNPANSIPIFEPIPDAQSFVTITKRHQPLYQYKPRHHALPMLEAIADHIVSPNLVYA